MKRIISNKITCNRWLWQLYPKAEFSTQRKVEEHFFAPEASEHDNQVKQKLFDLISNDYFV
jgi:hypothetical protein